MSLVAGAIRVRVPATSANLGPGYDALGLALQLHDDLVAHTDAHGLTVEITGEGATLSGDESHLVVRAMRATFARLDVDPPGVHLTCTNRIPHGRGLGSSSAAIVGGIVLARALVDGGAAALSDDDAFALAAELEGHGDNVAPCLFGGLTVCWSDGRPRAARLGAADGVHPVVLIPPDESSTAVTRSLLPGVVPHADAAFVAGRAALLAALLCGGSAGDPAALLAATEDRLHQPYRAAAMPATAELVARLRGAGLPAVVSGAGPTVLVLARDRVEVEAVGAYTPDGWRCVALPVDTAGARTVIDEPDDSSARSIG